MTPRSRRVTMQVMLNPHLERAAQLEGFLKVDPDNEALLGELADCHHRGGNQARALEIYERLGSLSGETTALLNARGSALLAMGRWGEAAEVLGRRWRATGRRRRCASIWATRSS